MKKWPWKIIAMIVLPMVALLLWYGNRDDGTIKWSSFYNLNVELEHLGKPLNLHVVISCGSVGRQILGEGRSARSYWAPYIFGIEDQGHGVLVQSRGDCGRDFEKHPMSADYMPVLFWAPDAKNLEFMIAYLHEDAYTQPVSKLRFIKATMTNATREEYEAWRKTGWKKNILPLASKYQDNVRGVSFFREKPGVEGETFWPAGDIRNLASPFNCYSMVRMKVPDELRDLVGRRWPSTKPNYWLLRQDQVQGGINSAAIVDAIRKLSVRSGGEDRSYEGTAHHGFANTEGVTRTTAAAKLPNPFGPDRSPRYDAGLMHRIPYRSEVGYPWASSQLTDTRVNTLTFDTVNGADNGFGYCYRNVVHAFLATPKLGDRHRFEIVPHTQRIVIDGQLIGTTTNTRNTHTPHDIIIERDEFIWSISTFPLAIEVAVNHQ
jgi:hypothetical protein